MSQEELSRLAVEKEALLAKLRALEDHEAEIKRAIQDEAERKRREAEDKRRREELEKPITIVVASLQGGSLMLVAPYREDTVHVFKTTPGRTYRGEDWESRHGRNLIPITEWARCEERLLNLQGTTIEWAKGVKEELEWYMSAPPWEVTVHHSHKYFIAKPGPRVSVTAIFRHILGASWNYQSRDWQVPLSEAWRIPEALKDVEGVVYSDAAQEIIFEQIEQRSRIDITASKEDSDDPRLDVLTREVWIPAEQRYKAFRDALKPFQRVGVSVMLDTGGRMILADGTGLGKTWQSIAYAEIRRATEPDFQTIIVAKAANMPNWLREVERLTGEELLTLRGGNPDFFDIQKVVNGHPYSIISYDTLGIKKVVEVDEPCWVARENDDHSMCVECGGTGQVKREKEIFPWVGIFKAANADLLILDEAHMVKTPDANRTQAVRELHETPHVLPMTASPILNRTEELWVPLFMVSPKVFKSREGFLNTYTWDGRRPRSVDKLHETLRPIFLRRRKKDVIKDLPPINRIEHLHELSPRAMHLYEKALRGIYQQLAEFDPFGIGGEEMNIMSILAKITRLKQICAADKVQFTADLATDLIDQASNGGKVLIFSQFKGTAHSIAQRLGHEAVCTVRTSPNGFTSMDAIKRDELFEEARHDEKVRFIVTTEAAKEGHNLEFCDWVIFNDLFWTPAGHDQCEGRAYGRLSDPHPIDSIYVVADIDIERWIKELLDTKLAIIEEAVEGVEASRDLSGNIGMELIKKIKKEMWKR